MEICFSYLFPYKKLREIENLFPFRHSNCLFMSAGRKEMRYLLPILLCLLLSACPMFTQYPTGQTRPVPILLTGTQATLQWDPPVTGAAQVVSYTLSYRVHGTSSWNTLATVPASATPSYTVLRSTTGVGSFDFAVASVSSTGGVSSMETSLDSTADPTTGWYITWLPR